MLPVVAIKVAPRAPHMLPVVAIKVAPRAPHMLPVVAIKVANRGSLASCHRQLFGILPPLH
jgi:hypothetical protein